MILKEEEGEEEEEEEEDEEEEETPREDSDGFLFRIKYKSNRKRRGELQRGFWQISIENSIYM